MPLGSEQRLEGMLLVRDGRLVLVAHDGSTWRLDAPYAVEALIGKRVIVEGVRVGFDLLEVRSMRRAGAASESAKPLWRRWFG